MSPRISFWDASSHTPHSTLDAAASFSFFFSGSSFFLFLLCFLLTTPLLSHVHGDPSCSPLCCASPLSFIMLPLSSCCVAFVAPCHSCHAASLHHSVTSPLITSRFVMSPSSFCPHLIARASIVSSSSSPLPLLCRPGLPASLERLAPTCALDLQRKWRGLVGGQGGVHMQAHTECPSIRNLMYLSRF